MEKKEIGILTFHRAENYGSVLQAFALQTVLLKMGYNSFIIDYYCKTDYKQYQLFRWYAYSKNRKLFVIDMLYFLPRVVRKRNFSLFRKKYLELSNKTYYNVGDLYLANDDFSTYICGSDQIWNVKATGGPDDAYFLKFVDGYRHKKIAYAPSMGERTIDNSSMNEVISALNDFYKISVRECGSKSMLSKKLPEKNICVALDPTLLLEWEDYQMFLSTSHGRKYIFVYLLGNIHEQPEIIQYVKELERRYGYPVIYIYQRNIKEFGVFNNKFYTGPIEFLNYINNAEYIVTNSFHATVFALLFHKKFRVFSPKATGMRIEELLKKVELLERLECSVDQLDTTIDYNMTDMRLTELKKESFKFLNDSLH